MVRSRAELRYVKKRAFSMKFFKKAKFNRKRGAKRFITNFSKFLTFYKMSRISLLGYPPLAGRGCPYCVFRNGGKRSETDRGNQSLSQMNMIPR